VVQFGDFKLLIRKGQNFLWIWCNARWFLWFSSFFGVFGQFWFGLNLLFLLSLWIYWIFQGCYRLLNWCMIGLLYENGWFDFCLYFHFTLRKTFECFSKHFSFDTNDEICLLYLFLSCQLISYTSVIILHNLCLHWLFQEIISNLGY